MINDDDNLIFRYTSDQAIEDGVLVHPYPNRWHGLLVTQTVYSKIQEICKQTNRKLDHALVPFLWDAIVCVKAAAKKDPNEHLFTDLPMQGNITGEEIWAGINDFGSFTVMFPSDY